MLQSHIIDSSFHSAEHNAYRSEGYYYSFDNCLSGWLNSKGTKLFNQYNPEFFTIIENLPQWEDCTSGYKFIEYDKYKTSEEFQTNLTKMLEKKFKKDKVLTEMTVAKINEEFTTTDLNILTEKWYKTGGFSNIVEAVEALPKNEQTPKLLTELTRAYHVIEDESGLKKSVKVLADLKGKITDLDYSYLLGYTHYYLTEFKKALTLFEIALPLDTNNIYKEISEYIEECKHFIENPYIFEVYNKINTFTKTSPKDLSINKDMELIGKKY